MSSPHRSPTGPYPMMMLPNGQTVPVLPGPVQMPSVISVSSGLVPWVLWQYKQKQKVRSYWLTCVFRSLAGPTRHVYGAQHSRNPGSSAGGEQQRIVLAVQLQSACRDKDGELCVCVQVKRACTHTLVEVVEMFSASVKGSRSGEDSHSKHRTDCTVCTSSYWPIQWSIWI